MIQSSKTENHDISQNDVRVEWGAIEDIDSWMELVRKLRNAFPGLETEESLKEHEATVRKFIGKRQAICVKEENEIKAVLLFSRNRNMICCLGVDPDFRKKGLATALLQQALDELDRTKDITVSTVREGDPRATAPRALYKKFGFVEGELTIEFDYPNQVLVLPGSTQRTRSTTLADAGINWK